MQANSTKNYKKKVTRPSVSQSAVVRREVAKQMAKGADYKHTIMGRTLSNTVSYSGTVFDAFQNLSRGDDPVNQFSGSSLQVKSIRVRGQCFLADSTNAFRFIVFQWRDSGTPAPTGILNDGSTTNAPFGTRFWANKKNIKVLSDNLYNLNTQNNSQVIDLYVPGTKCARTWFQTSSPTPQNNGIFILMISDSSTVTHPICAFTCETVFTD